MENWIGAAVWIVIGGVVGLSMKLLVKNPSETPGHAVLLFVLGAFAAAIGGMLGVGIFEWDDPTALSVGGMAGALVFSAMMTWVYRWGVKGLT